MLTQSNPGAVAFSPQQADGRTSCLATRKWFVECESEAPLHAHEEQPRGSGVCAADVRKCRLPGDQKVARRVAK